MEEVDNKTENLADFVQQCKVRLKKIIERLEWSEEMVKKNFNTNSLASKLTSKQPKEVKPPKIAEYPDSCCNQNNLVLDTARLRELLQDHTVESPHNFEELQANFNREQKLKIYQHVIENTKKIENNLEAPVAEGELTLAEIVAQNKREEKRKKRKFRKSKPTHIEEVRCLVKLQMKALREFLIKRNGNEMKTENESHSKELTKYSKRNGNDMETINKSRKQNPQGEEYTDIAFKHSQKRDSRRISPNHSKELTKSSKRNASEMEPISKSRVKNHQKDNYRVCNKKDYHKSQQRDSRAYDKEFRKTSTIHSRELIKQKHSNYSHSSNKDLKNGSKRRSRSRSKDLNTDRRKTSSNKKSRKSRERKNYEKSSRELNNKHERRSRSSSYDRRTYKSYYRSKASRSRSPHFDSQRSRRSRTKSPYGKDMKRRNYHKSDPQKRRSRSRESVYSKVYIKEDSTLQRSKNKYSTSRDQDYTDKNRRYSKEDSLNEYKVKEGDYYEKSSEHKHTKVKKEITEK